MTKSKLAITCLLTASILSPVCASALTQQEAASIAISAQTQATLTSEQKRAAVKALSVELGKINQQIDQKTAKLNSNKTERTITLSLTAAGAAAVGYLLVVRPAMGGEVGGKLLEGLYYSFFVTAGTVPFALDAYSLNKQIRISTEDIIDLKIKLNKTQEQLDLQLQALN